jgi:hypothetical protein
MNPRNLHLSKEYRAIRPFWLVALALPLAPLLFAPYSQEISVFCIFGYILGCTLLGAVVFGSEWNHRTMDLLLVQPVSRTRLWRDKMRVLCFTLVTMGVAFLPGLLSQRNEMVEYLGSPYGAVWIVFPVFWTLGVGPFFSLCLGSGIGGFVFSILAPFGWIGGMLFLLPSGWKIIAYENSEFGYFVPMVEFFVFAVPLILFAIAGWRLARYRFYHLETVGTANKALQLTDWVFGLFKTSEASGEKRSALGMLIRKEFRLHEISDIVASFTTLVSAITAAYFLAYNAICAEPMNGSIPGNTILILAMLTAIIIPLTVGASAVSEERQMGMLDWHLTLPPSRLRQWSIKMIVAYGHHIVLGMVLPLSMLAASEWICETKPYVLNIDFHDYSSYMPVLAASMMGVTVSLFASSLAKTTLRAILIGIGTIMLATTIAGTMLASNEYYHFFDSDSGMGRDALIIAISLGAGSFKYWLAGILAAAIVGSILRLGYGNYRRLENRLGAATQIALVGFGLILLAALPVAIIVFPQIDARIQETGLSGRALAAFLAQDDPQRVIAAIGEAMDDPVRGPRAFWNLGQFNDWPEAEPLIFRGFSHPISAIRESALTLCVDRLGCLEFSKSGQAKQLKDKLWQYVRDTNAPERAFAVLVLAAKRADPDNLVPLLTGLLADSNSPVEVRLHAVMALGKFGAAAKAAVPALEKIALANPKRSDLHLQALKALKSIDPESALKYPLEVPNPPGKGANK